MSNHIHNKVNCLKCDAEFCMKCVGNRCPKGHAYYGEVQQARMDAEKAMPPESRYKPTVKTLTFRVRVSTTEFQVLADAICGEIDDSLAKNHGCKLVRRAVAHVDGKLVDFRQKPARKGAKNAQMF